MKPKNIITLATLAFVLSNGHAAIIGTEFTYQGRLTDAVGPPNGSYDFTFTLHLAASGGVPIVTVTNLNTAVSNGLFATTVDFGGGIYNGNAYWIALGVRSNGADGNFTALTPRQPLTPAPNASYASLAGTVPGGSITAAKLAVDSVSTSALQNNAVTAAKVATGEVVKSLNGLRDDVALSAGSNVTITPSGNTLTIAGSSGWKLGGNAGTTAGADFLGTTDNQALELKVNGVRGFRLQPGTVSPNVVGGGFSAVAAGLNAVTIGGGQENNVSSHTSTIGGGFRNFIGSGGQDSTIGGGQVNSISNNTAAATVAGGNLNAIGAGSPYAAIGGGRFNHIADGGAQSTIGGGRNNLIAVNSTAATIAGGQNNIATNAHSAVAGGGWNTASGISSFIGGGGGDTFGGPWPNTASGNWSAILGGWNNIASGYSSAIGGGFYNTASGYSSTISGGSYNVAGGQSSFAAGNRAKANHDGAFVWADSTAADFASTAADQFAIRARGGVVLSGSTPNLSFGTTTRQMLNLWGTQYGIGVQGYTLYSRADVGAGFAWYQGGTHSDAAGDAGGGQTLMSLDSSGATLQGNLTFGTSSLRQMLDLNGGQHGIGVQAWATYFRTIGGGANGGFAWYQGGVHANGQFDAGGGQTLMNLDSSGLNVAGKVAYTGQLSKLDVAENFEARVRAADFFLGHSSRRGTPGRALVDNGGTLELNFASDWANTVIGGANVSVCTLTIRGGCDLAEPFKMSSKDLPKGAVVVIDEANPGHLKLSESAYDTRVAGIISGANGVNTGVTLTQDGVMEGDQNVALSGRVYVQAEASNGDIKPGDLLTTSATPGYAMKVADHAKAQGAILGKAMTSLAQGQGMVLVLVTLQ